MSSSSRGSSRAWTTRFLVYGSVTSHTRASQTSLARNTSTSYANSVRRNIPLNKLFSPFGAWVGVSSKWDNKRTVVWTGFRLNLKWVLSLTIGIIMDLRERTRNPSSFAVPIPFLGRAIVHFNRSSGWHCTSTAPTHSLNVTDGIPNVLSSSCLSPAT